MPNPLNLNDAPNLKDKGVKKVYVKNDKKPLKPKKRKLLTEGGHMLV